MSITLIVLVITVIILFSIITNHINHRLNKVENKLINIHNDIKYNQYLINTRDKQEQDTTDNDRDIKVVIYGNDKEVYKYWRD